MRKLIISRLNPILLILIFLSGTTFAGESPTLETQLQPPPPGHLQIITTQDGSRTFGRIVSHDEQSCVFATEMGDLTIPLERIRSIQVIAETALHDGEYWFPNPNSTRLYFAPSGRMLPQGSGYFADYYFFFPTVVYGFTDRFTFGGGFSLFPGASLNKQLWYITPKFGLISQPEFNAAIGALVVGVPALVDEEDVPNLVGVLYGVGTLGGPDKSMTLGLGYGFVDDDLAEHPMVTVGGEYRAWRRAAFVTENWWLPGVDFPIVSYGLRFFGERMSVDFAFLNFLEEPIFPGVPYIDFTVNF
ncbi:hypothetical protein H8D51_01555 [bacterium]|nr:hypothetical protein [bacterium]